MPNRIRSVEAQSVCVTRPDDSGRDLKTAHLSAIVTAILLRGENFPSVKRPVVAAATRRKRTTYFEEPGKSTMADIV